MRLSLAFSSCSWRSCARCETVMPEGWLFHLQYVGSLMPCFLHVSPTLLDFLEDVDRLRFAESGFLHVETPLLGIPYLCLVQVFKGT
jgi:hypothetical protein